MKDFLIGIVAGIIISITYRGLSVLSNKFILLWMPQLESKDDRKTLGKILQWKLDKIVPLLLIILIFIGGWIFGGLL